jgi:hypothetical protein
MSSAPAVRDDNATTEEPSLFDSLSCLVPEDLQKQYYRVLAHTHTLSPMTKCYASLKQWAYWLW